MDSSERGMNPVAIAIIYTQKTFWKSQRLNEQYPTGFQVLYTSNELCRISNVGKEDNADTMFSTLAKTTSTFVYKNFHFEQVRNFDWSRVIFVQLREAGMINIKMVHTI